MNDKIIDARNFNYEEWEKAFFSKTYLQIFPQMCFPNELVKEYYLSNIRHKSDLEVREILRRFLIKTTSLGCDHNVHGYLLKLDNEKLKASVDEVEYFHRIFFSPNHTWEGLTWILDLLPHFPKEAIKGIDAYFLANCQFMPDFVLAGISDCTSIIRAKYFEIEHPNKFLLEIEPREFEWLIDELYKEMGYNTKLTASSYDGEVDIIAEKSDIGQKETTLVQCKKYKSNIGVSTVRELGGVVADRKATKGVIVTTAHFTREASKYSEKNPSIELIDYPKLNRLLNIHINAGWPLKMDAIFRARRFKESKKMMPTQS